MDAARVQCHDVIPLLFSYGCDPHVVTQSGETALSIACRLGGVEVVRALLGCLLRVDLDSALDWPSAIHWACQSLDSEIVEMILRFGCEMYRVDRNGVLLRSTANGTRLFDRL
jgi:ankyrin repeat protein